MLNYGGEQSHGKESASRLNTKTGIRYSQGLGWLRFCRSTYRSSQELT
jgi:hypothetical protein